MSYPLKLLSTRRMPACAEIERRRPGEVDRTGRTDSPPTPATSTQEANSAGSGPTSPSPTARAQQVQPLALVLPVLAMVRQAARRRRRARQQASAQWPGDGSRLRLLSNTIATRPSQVPLAERPPPLRVPSGRPRAEPRDARSRQPAKSRRQARARQPPHVGPRRALQWRRARQPRCSSGYQGSRRDRASREWGISR
jgi:hypothetical protein